MFIDTSIFLDILYSDDSLKNINKFIKELDSNKITLVLPVVIFKEIEKDFEFWKKELVDLIQKQLEIDCILGVTDGKTTGGKNSIDKKTNGILIEKITRKNREEIIEIVKNFYKKIEEKINIIFEHKNTKKIMLNNDIILKGIERSLMKKAPSTKLDKKTEKQHLKDVDCIAFESILNFFEVESIKKNDIFYIIVKDDDYEDDKNFLRSDLVNDLLFFQKDNIKYEKSVECLFNKKNKKEGKEVSLSNHEKSELIESSNKSNY